MRETLIIFLVAFATCLQTGLSEDNVQTHEKRLITTFQVVRFPNDACVGSNSRNGTCFTSAECSDKGGTNAGSCADGFGVCCTFVITACGMSSSQNITYWDQTPTILTTAPSSCTLTIYPLNDNICQLRMDFDTFVLTGPSTTTISENNMQLGQGPIWLGGIADNTGTSWKTNCLHDSFSVNGRSSANIPPTICGTNTGYHMYVDADDTNVMTFTFAPTPGSAPATGIPDTWGLSSLADRNWDIKIQQYECGHINAAPPGCTQYYWGPVKGDVRSYNYAGAVHIAHQNQKVCIRRERSYCYACFALESTTVANFQISGANGVPNVYTSVTQACGWGGEAANGLGDASNEGGAYDCVIIPGAFIVADGDSGGGGIIVASNTAANIRTLAATTYQVPAPPHIGGNNAFGVGGITLNIDENYESAAGSATLMSVCTKHVPFSLQFRSDDYEGTGGGGDYTVTQTGFKLAYQLLTCT